MRWKQARPYVLGAGALAAVGVLLGEPEIRIPMNAQPANFAKARALAEKWGPVFGVPAAWILAIIGIESSYRPGLFNLNARALIKGGAWGLMAMTLDTAQGIAVRLRRSSVPIVRTTVARWDGTGKGLLDPDINVLMGTEYMARVAKLVGKDFKLVAAGYHQGPGKVLEMQKAKQAIPAELPRYGKQYVALALEQLAKVTA